MNDAVFRRVTGVKRRTFNYLVSILNTADTKQKARGGRKNKLSTKIRLRMTLKYWREYTTYLHIAEIYGVSESTAYKNIRWVEDALIQSKIFNLPGAKSLLDKDFKDAILLIDVTESPVERPKKNNVNFTQERKNATL